MIDFKKEMETVNQELRKFENEIKGTPGVFIGKKSLHDFAIYISGYAQCLAKPIYEKIRERRENGEEIGYGDFNKTFQKFIEKYYDLNENEHLLSTHWSEIIRFFTPSDEAAFDEYFRLMEEYEKTIKE